MQQLERSINNHIFGVKAKTLTSSLGQLNSPQSFENNLQSLKNSRLYWPDVLSKVDASVVPVAPWRAALFWSAAAVWNKSIYQM